MRKTMAHGGVFLLFLLSGLMAAAGGALAVDHSYHEDFTTTQYRDTVNTTANWDTVAGQLRKNLFEFTEKGHYDTDGTAYALALSGNYAFIADYANGVAVIDISDPETPSYAGGYITAGSAFGLAVDGDYLYVAATTAGLVVLDISTPASPTLAGSYNTAGSAYDVFIDGDYAYVADRTNGLVIVDISDPASPSLAGHYNTTGTSYSVQVSGNYAYVADSGSGLQVIDVTDPTSPSFAGGYDTGGYSWDIDIEGDLLYLADDDGGVYVIEIVQPSKPKFIANLSTPSPALGIEVGGDLAYIACQNSGLIIVDIIDPTAPEITDSCDTPGSSHDVSVAGGYAFIADGSSGLRVIDAGYLISYSPRHIDEFGANDFQDLEIEGDLAYLLSSNSGLLIVDITDRFLPVEVGRLSISGEPWTIDVAGDVAYVGDHLQSFRSVNIKNSSAPALIDSVALPDDLWDVAVAGDYAYIGCAGAGLRVLDISDPSAMSFIGSYDPTLEIRAVEVCGDLLFAGTTSGILIIDISTPASPALVYYLDMSDEPVDFAVSGDYLYCITSTSRYFQVIDISEPSAPFVAGSHFIVYFQPKSLAISGDYAVVSLADEDIRVFDISDPTSPSNVYYSEANSEANKVCIEGGLLYYCYENALTSKKLFEDVVRSGSAARSIPINDLNESPAAIRASMESGPYGYNQLLIMYGASFVGIDPNGEYTFNPNLELWPEDFVWNIELNYSVQDWRDTPWVSSLDIDWLYQFPTIISVFDVPGDQGGWARVHFSQSAYDLPETPRGPITEYSLWRRFDGFYAPEVEGPVPEGDRPFAFVEQDGLRLLDSRSAAAATFPPGTWEYLGSMPSMALDDYIYLTPTMADSSAAGTNYTVYVVTAHTDTPSVYFTSPPDSGYSVDNIAPGVPLGLAIAYNTGSGNTLDWTDSPEEDFQYYRVYRGDSEEFVPGPGTLVHETVVSSWSDPEYDGWNVYYKVTALDHAGNESGPAGAGTVTGDDTPELPTVFALHQNVPNPFNPSTTIRFELPAATHVKLTVYDVNGRLVATLADRVMDPGSKEIRWEGRDRAGNSVASGIYFYRLTAADFSETRKMVLLR